ncbi:MAG: class I SAM-dependent RNA methyltransferase [Fibrobacterales bacterium]
MTSNFTITIDSVATGGAGVGRLDGRAVFVPYTVPGDVCRVLAIKTKKRFIIAKLLEVVEPSAQRITPQCRHFTICGGCDYQHIAYDEQCRIKQQHIVDALERIGKLSLSFVPDVVASKPWHYRNRARLQITTKKGKRFAGFNKDQSNELVGIEECPVLCEPLEAHVLTHDWQEYPRSNVRLFSDGSDVIQHDDMFSISLLNKKVFLSNRVFFQSNLELLPQMISYVIDGVSGAVAMDLFSGVGLFALFLQDHFDRVIAVEINDKCQQIAEEHLEDHVERYYEPVEEWVKNNQETTVDFLLVDPPRQGVEVEAIEHILSIKPKLIVYVSCDPVTMARDLALLTKSQYEIIGMKGFDMFPQTSHIECVTKLKRIT